MSEQAVSQFQVNGATYYDGVAHHLTACRCTLTTSRLSITDTRGRMQQIQLHQITGVTPRAGLISQSVDLQVGTFYAIHLHCSGSSDVQRVARLITDALDGKLPSSANAAFNDSVRPDAVSGESDFSPPASRGIANPNGFFLTILAVIIVGTIVVALATSSGILIAVVPQVAVLFWAATRPRRISTLRRTILAVWVVTLPALFPLTLNSLALGAIAFFALLIPWRSKRMADR